MAFVETVASVDEATELVVESIPEEIGVKVVCPRRFGEVAPGRHDRLEHLDDPVDRARRCDRRSRADGRHPLLEPSAAMPLVEIVAGERTSEKTLETVSTRLAAPGRSRSTSSEMFRASSEPASGGAPARVSVARRRGCRDPRDGRQDRAVGAREAVPRHGAVRDGRPGRDRFMDEGRSEPVSPAVERDRPRGARTLACLRRRSARRRQGAPRPRARSGARPGWGSLSQANISTCATSQVLRSFAA